MQSIPLGLMSGKGGGGGRKEGGDEGDGSGLPMVVVRGEIYP